jgi:hypothetical protein
MSITARLPTFVLIFLIGVAPSVGCSGSDLSTPTTGTVAITPLPSNLNAPWSLAGPNYFQASGTGNFSRSALDTGDYTVTWQDVAGWRPPVPLAETRTLGKAATVKFIGVYSDTAGPSIASVWGPTADGSSLTIVGSGFGNHDVDVEWIGGPSGLIENSPSGTTFQQQVASGWGQTLSSELNPPTITKERPHSYGQSIAVHHRNGYAGGFEYRRAQHFQELYATWWVYHSHLSSGNSVWTHKIWRLNDGPANARINDHPGEIYIGATYTLPNQLSFREVFTHCAIPRCWGPQPPSDCTMDCPSGSGSFFPCPCNDCRSGNPQMNSYAAVAPSDIGKWVRYEVYAKRSTVDVKNGTLQWWMTFDGDKTYTLVDYSPTTNCVARDPIAGPCPLCTHRTLNSVPASPNPCTNVTPVDWEWLIWQNHYGSHGSSVPESADFFFDDIYLQFDGGKARVEIGNARTWNACTRREIQKPLSWSSGSINIALNYGSFSPSDEAYVFVVTEDGTVSAGWPLSLTSPGP